MAVCASVSFIEERNAANSSQMEIKLKQQSLKIRTQYAQNPVTSGSKHWDSSNFSRKSRKEFGIFSYQAGTLSVSLSFTLSQLRWLSELLEV